MGKKRRLSKLAAVPIAPTSDSHNNKNGSSHQTERGDNNGDTNETVPMRNTDRLWASRVTLDCAASRNCVPCAYKIGLFDVALDKEFCKATPNQRPEQCPRDHYNDKHNHDHDGGLLGFRPGMSILTVGDGDFSFSLGLARKLFKKSSGANNKPKTFLVATSYESESTLRKVYPDFDETLGELRDLGAHLAYNVDATRIPETLPTNLRRRFHRICWNFPCTAIGGGQDGQNKAMEENKTLVRRFVESSRSVLTSGGDGELCICHKTKPPFNQWNLEEVALEHQASSALPKTHHPLLYYSGRIVLDRFLLPPYTPRKALDKKSFPCHDACFYIFAQEKHHLSPVSKQKLFVPTIPEDPIDREGDDDDVPSPATLLKINPERIRILRQQFMNNTKISKKRKRNGKHKHKHKHKSGNFANMRRS